MKDSKNAFNILVSIEKHIEGLKPLVPKQAIVCIGEYPIKTLLKEPTVNREGALPIFIEKSSDDIYKWLPKDYNPHLIVGYEDSDIDTHFWYSVLPTVIRDKTVINSIKKRSADKLRGAIIFGSIWDGVGSAAVPSLIAKFRSQNIDSLSIAIMPSKIQPADAHFNAYATLQRCLATEGSTVLLLDRDLLETFEGVDKKGTQIKGNSVVNYLLDLFLAKESLVREISELSRTFNIKLFGAVAVTAASYRVYGSVENMLDTALLKPLSSFDLSSASLLYVLLRMPTTLKDSVPRVKIELAITNWFKEKTNPQSIHISEPIYTEDMSDRVDAVLFVGGFDTVKMFAELEEKTSALKGKAVERGFMTEDWQLPFKVEEEPEVPEVPVAAESQETEEQPPQTEETQPAILAEASLVTEEPQTVQETTAQSSAVEAAPIITWIPSENGNTEKPQPATVIIPEPAESPKQERPKRTRSSKKAEPKPKETTEKPKRAARTKKAQTKPETE